MYKVIELKDFKKIKQFNWFKTFANPCYGFDVKMDVTELVKYTKDTSTSFFINTLYLVTTGLSSVEELRIRYVDNQIRLYDKINPTFTVMTDLGVYENAGFKMIDDYETFYKEAKRVIESVKAQKEIKQDYNSDSEYDAYYITCIPWLTYISMTHPLPDNNFESSSCPRVCWDKYFKENERIYMHLNITVSHCFVDGYPLSCAFKNIQERFSNPQKYFENK